MSSSNMPNTAISVANSVSRAVAPLTGTPAKPQSSTTSQTTPQTPNSNSQIVNQPGTWKHPRMDEIARRQNADVFNKDNINRALFNGVMLISSFIIPSYTANMFVYNHVILDRQLTIPRMPSIIKSQMTPLQPYQIYPFLLIRLYFLLNLILAFRPLWAPKDEINDIPLTPSQRALLGLRPTTAPHTPGGSYITPPRYSRSVTPRSSASRAGSQSPAGSPLTNRGRSGSMERSIGGGSRGASGSPYGSGSPLVQKALSGSTSRRLSFDSGSSSGLPSTPNPAIGTGRASVGLNNKWLYERGRGSPNGRGLFA